MILPNQQLKVALLKHCIDYASERIATARLAMEAAQAAANAEEKSSAGDKYETTRALMQIERDKAAEQLEEALKLRQVVESIRPDVKNNKITLGSLILTDNVHFYIAISAGKVTIDDQVFLTISAQAPIALTLSKLKQGDRFDFNKQLLTILEVV